MKFSQTQTCNINNVCLRAYYRVYEYDEELKQRSKNI